jgi:hypothetical protein
LRGIEDEPELVTCPQYKVSHGGEGAALSQECDGGGFRLEDFVPSCLKHKQPFGTAKRSLTHGTAKSRNKRNLAGTLASATANTIDIPSKRSILLLPFFGRMYLGLARY